jgi:hypothetical protein
VSLKELLDPIWESVDSCWECANDSRAVWSAAGNTLPRLFARRKMPADAFALKENLLGAVGFKTCDNEHSTASLGDSEVASIKSSPRDRVPELIHFTEESEEITALIGTEETWDVLQHQPPRTSSLHKVEECEGE